MIVKINEGSFGQVYKITENENKNGILNTVSYALKIIPNKSYGIDCFLEILILCFLNYKFLMCAYDFFIDNENKISKILMPLADNDLYKFMKKHSKGIKNKDLLLKICWQLACAVGFLHSRNIIHGDIKLSNVLVKYIENKISKDVCISGNKISKYPKIYLSDFSFACLSFNEKYRIYNPETYSYHYRPPEVNSGKGYNFKADVWALGCTFYELLYNEPFVLSNSTVANLKYAYNKLQNEEDKDLRSLLLNMLHPCESLRYNIWQVLESDYFKSVKNKEEDITFPLNYNNLNFKNSKDYALFLKQKIDDKEKIPDYIYEILCMKLSNRSIEKSYFSLLDSQIFLKEKLILEKINKDKIVII
jgi:serine/threonine protein kinase